MNPLRQRLAEYERTARKGLMPYITAGYPDLATTVDILTSLDPRRCLCVELGVPFSDPIADGPVIQTSFSRALDAGFRLDALLDALQHARERIAVPVVLMLSYTIVFRRGAAALVRRMAEVGVSAMITPDISLEEAQELAGAGSACDCPLIMLVTPASSPGRRAQIAAISAPFIYYQSLAGITGERRTLPADLAHNVQGLRAESGKPVCVGFGISRPEHVAEVCRVADGAIVGSAIVRRMIEAVDEGATGAAITRRVCRFIDELSAPLA